MSITTSYFTFKIDKQIKSFPTANEALSNLDNQIDICYNQIISLHQNTFVPTQAKPLHKKVIRRPTPSLTTPKCVVCFGTHQKNYYYKENPAKTLCKTCYQKRRAAAKALVDLALEKKHSTKNSKRFY